MVYVLTWAIRRGNFHGVRRDVHGIHAAIPAGTGLGNPLLVTRELDELPKIFLAQSTQSVPEKLNMLICLHQANLVHGMGLQENIQIIEIKKGQKIKLSFTFVFQCL